MFNLGQNTAAKVTLFYGLRKYFIKKMHNLVLLCAQNARNVQVF